MNWRSVFLFDCANQCVHKEHHVWAKGWSWVHLTPVHPHSKAGNWFCKHAIRFAAICLGHRWLSGTGYVTGLACPTGLNGFTEAEAPLQEIFISCHWGKLSLNSPYSGSPLQSHLHGAVAITLSVPVTAENSEPNGGHHSWRSLSSLASCRTLGSVNRSRQVKRIVALAIAEAKT